MLWLLGFNTPTKVQIIQKMKITGGTTRKSKGK